MTILKYDNIVGYFRHGQILVDETVAKISDLQKEGKLNDGQFNFLLYLLSKKELSFKDVSIITLSLYGDGLNSVRTDCVWPVKSCNILLFSLINTGNTTDLVWTFLDVLIFFLSFSFNKYAYYNCTTPYYCHNNIKQNFFME